MNVYVDLSDVVELERAATGALRTIRGAFDRAGKDAAKHSRTEHAYVNRTHKTQDNTRSVTVSEDGNTYTLVEIDVPHASFLMAGGTSRRGASLTAMESATDRMQTTLDYAVEGAERAAER